MIWEKRVGGKYYTPHLMQDIYLPNFAIAIARCRKKASFGFASASGVVHSTTIIQCHAANYFVMDVIKGFQT